MVARDKEGRSQSLSQPGRIRNEGMREGSHKTSSLVDLLQFVKREKERGTVFINTPTTRERGQERERETRPLVYNNHPL